MRIVHLFREPVFLSALIAFTVLVVGLGRISVFVTTRQRRLQPMASSTQSGDRRHPVADLLAWLIGVALSALLFVSALSVGHLRLR